MELRLLSMEKHGDNYWVFEAHPATPDKKTITHTSEHTISNMSDYKRFQEVNNTAVKYAHELGIDLSKEYTLFFTLGIRVSQQLDSIERQLIERGDIELEDRVGRYAGRVKEITMPKYNEAEWHLENELKKGIAKHYSLKAHDELEKLASPELIEGVSAEDQATITDYVDRLQRVPFPKDKTGHIQYPLLPKEDFIAQGSFDAMISFFVRDMKNMTNPTVERYSQVPAAARSEFLALCRYEDLFGKVVHDDFFENDFSQENLIGLIKGLEPNDTKKFFTVLQRELEREDDFDTFYKLIGYSLSEDDKLNSEQSSLFCELLVRAQDAGIENWRESVPIDVAQLLGAYSAEETLDIANQAFEIVRSGEMPFDFLKKKAEERKTV